MNSITVLHNQSLLDICIQRYGSLQPLFELALANSVPVTAIIETGTELLVPESTNKNIAILSYYTTKNIKPATALSTNISIILKNNEPCDLCALFK